MVDLSEKHDAGRLERVIHGELNGQIEDTTGIRGICRAEDGAVPLEHILVVNGSCATVGRRVLTQVNQLLLDSLGCHSLM